jgi:hypothetical protein
MHLRLLRIKIRPLPQVPLRSLRRTLITRTLIPRPEPINRQRLNSRVDRNLAPVLTSATHHRFMLRQHALGRIRVIKIAAQVSVRNRQPILPIAIQHPQALTNESFQRIASINNSRHNTSPH